MRILVNFLTTTARERAGGGQGGNSFLPREVAGMPHWETEGDVRRWPGSFPGFVRDDEPRDGDTAPGKAVGKEEMPPTRVVRCSLFRGR